MKLAFGIQYARSLTPVTVWEIESASLALREQLAHLRG